MIKSWRGKTICRTVLSGHPGEYMAGHMCGLPKGLRTRGSTLISAWSNQRPTARAISKSSVAIDKVGERESDFIGALN